MTETKSLLDMLAPGVAVEAPEITDDVTTAGRLWKEARQAMEAPRPSRMAPPQVNWPILAVSVAATMITFAAVFACIAIVFSVWRSYKADEEVPKWVRSASKRKNIRPAPATELGRGLPITPQFELPMDRGDKVLFQSPVYYPLPPLTPPASPVLGTASPPMVVIRTPLYEQQVKKTVFTNHSLHAITAV